MPSGGGLVEVMVYIAVLDQDGVRCDLVDLIGDLMCECVSDLR